MQKKSCSFIRATLFLLGLSLDGFENHEDY